MKRISILLLMGVLIIVGCTNKIPTKPNIVYVFADQWRAQAMGYAGNPDVITPYLDELSAEDVAIS